MDEAVLRAINSLAANSSVASAGIFLSSIWPVLLVTSPLALYLAYRRRWLAIASKAGDDLFGTRGIDGN